MKLECQGGSCTMLFSPSLQPSGIDVITHAIGSIKQERLQGGDLLSFGESMSFIAPFSLCLESSYFLTMLNEDI